MTDIRTWMDKGNISAIRARKALPILVRQARAEQPITYSDLAKELGMNHHRPVRYPAGYIAFTLDAIGKSSGWMHTSPPPLQSLIVKNGSGLPGSGVDHFMGHLYRQAKTLKQRKAALNAVHAQLYAYPYWENILELLGLNPAPLVLDELLSQAKNASARGGEGPDHKALKEFVAAHPSIVGLSSNHDDGETEFKLASGDRVDVVFEGKGLKTAVEVKSRISGDDDIARGLFQCLKYRVVLEAEAALSEHPFDVLTFLVVGRDFPAKLLPLKNSLGVVVVDGVVPSAM